MTLSRKILACAVVAGLAGMIGQAAPVFAADIQLADGDKDKKHMDRAKDMHGKADEHMKDAEKKHKGKRHDDDDDVKEMKEKGKKHGMKGRENAMERGEGQKKGLKRMMEK